MAAQGRTLISSIRLADRSADLVMDRIYDLQTLYLGCDEADSICIRNIPLFKQRSTSRRCKLGEVSDCCLNSRHVSKCARCNCPLTTISGRESFPDSGCPLVKKEDCNLRINEKQKPCFGLRYCHPKSKKTDKKPLRCLFISTQSTAFRSCIQELER